MENDPIFKVVLRSGVILCLANYIAIIEEYFIWQTGWMPIYVFTAIVLTYLTYGLWKGKRENDRIQAEVERLIKGDKE